MSESDVDSGLMFHPDNMSTGGGLDDCWVTILDPKIIEWRGPDGQFENPSVGFMFTALVDGEDAPRDNPQFYSIGKPENVCPSEDGTELVVINENVTRPVSTRSNFGRFMEQAIKGGFPLSKVSNSVVEMFQGVKAHFMPFDENKKKLDGSAAFPKYFPVGWDFPKGGGKKKKGKKGKKGKGASAASGDDDDELIAKLGPLVRVYVDEEELAKFTTKDLQKALSKNAAFEDLKKPEIAKSIKLLLKETSCNAIAKAAGVEFDDGMFTDEEEEED